MYDLRIINDLRHFTMTLLRTILSATILLFVSVSALKAQNVFVNEIMYNFGYNLNPFEADDWIELHNNSATPADISNWTVQFGTDTYVLPSYIIPAFGYVLVVESDSLLNLNYPGVPYLGPTNFGLNDSGESIKVYDAANVLIDEVNYSDIFPWPPAGDGFGMSIMLSSPLLNNAIGSAWIASGTIGGTIAAPNNVICGSAIPDVVINEINYKSSFSLDPGDWVELHNATASAVDISGWLFSDSDFTYHSAGKWLYSHCFEFVSIQYCFPNCYECGR